MAIPASSSDAASHHWLRKVCLLSRSNVSSTRPQPSSRPAPPRGQRRSASTVTAAVPSSNTGVPQPAGSQRQIDTDAVGARSYR